MERNRIQEPPVCRPSWRHVGLGGFEACRSSLHEIISILICAARCPGLEFCRPTWACRVDCASPGAGLQGSLLRGQQDTPLQVSQIGNLICLLRRKPISSGWSLRAGKVYIGSNETVQFLMTQESGSSGVGLSYLCIVSIVIQSMHHPLVA